MERRDDVPVDPSSGGPPNNGCDRICDADARAYIGPVVLATARRMILAGAVRGVGLVTPEMLIEVARQASLEIANEQQGVDWQHASIECYLQTGDLAGGTDARGSKAACPDDQGIIFGYVCRGTADFTPPPIYAAHAVLGALAAAGASSAVPPLGPNAESQISLQRIAGKTVCISSVVIPAEKDGSSSRDANAVFRCLQTIFGPRAVRVWTFSCCGPVIAEVMIFPDDGGGMRGMRPSMTSSAHSLGSNA
jgi:S-adenosylmethionine synthetase